MKKEIRDEIITFAKQQFAFLKVEKGFTKPLINRPNQSLLIYRSATMQISIEMSLWAQGMDILIEKLGSDGKPDRELHRRTVWLLESLLTRLLHVEDERILALDQIRLTIDRWYDTEWGKRQWKRVINLYQALLRDHIDLILQQPFDVLFPTALEYTWSTEEWERLLDDHFTFLQEYGFGPHPVFAVELWLYIYTWMSADRGIQLILDSRDIDLYCYMVRLIDGKIPTTEKKMVQKYEHFIRGEEAEVHLVVLLSKRLGIADADIERIDNLDRILNIRHMSDCDYSYYSTYVMEYANLVRRYIKVLMDTPLETLFTSSCSSSSSL